MARQSLLSAVLALRTDQFERGLTAAERKFNATTARMQNVGRKLTIGLTAPLAAIGASSFKVAADFELAMKKVKAVSQTGDADFKRLTQNARDLGASTVFSASSVASLQLEMAKLGQSADGIIKSTDSTLALAQAFGYELGPTAETVIKTMNQFSSEALTASEVSDLLATAFGGSALDLEKFSGAMSNAGLVADTFGFSLKETTALLGVMANNGLEGTDAGTKLKMAFSELAAEGVDVKKTFSAIINGSMSYKDAIDVLGKRAAILAPLFGNNTEMLAEFGKALDASEGSASAMAAEMDDSAKGGIASMQSAVEGAQIALGNALAPTVLAVADKIKELAQGFQELDPSTQKSIVKFGLFAAAIGPVTSGIASMVRGIKDVLKALKLTATFLKTNPYGLILSTAVLAAGALYHFATNSDTASAAAKKMNDQIREQNELLISNSKGLATRGALLRDAFFLSANQGTIEELQGRISSIRTDLENLSPEALGNAIALDADFSALEAGGTPLNVLTTPRQQKDVGIQLKDLALTLGAGTDEYVAARQKLLNEVAGTDLSASLQTIAAAVNPFGTLSVDEEFNAIRAELVKRQAELQTELDKKVEQTSTKVKIDIDIPDVKTPVRTLEDIQTELQKQLTDISELESLFGENLNSDKFKAIETAIKEIVKGDFKNVDAILDDLVSKMAQFAEEAEKVITPTDNLKTAMERLQVQRGLGIIDDLNFAQQAMGELERALTESILNDPTFIGTDQFRIMNEQLKELQSIMAETAASVEEPKFQLFDLATAGQVAGDVLATAFEAATNKSVNFGDAVKSMFRQLISNAIRAAVAQAIQLAFAPTPDNVATGGAAGLAKAAAYKAAIASLLSSVPKLATGGMTLGPQLALIGDNPSGREAVIPMERMGSFLGHVAGFNQNMNVTGRINGSDILLSQERAKRNRGR